MRTPKSLIPAAAADVQARCYATNQKFWSKLTPEQAVTLELLSACDIHISWRAVKPHRITDPITWIEANFGGPVDGELIHEASGGATRLTGLASAVLDYAAATGVIIRGVCRAYAHQWPVPPEFVEWLARRGQKIKRSGKWYVLEKAT